ncbi:WxL domain-containing protein [Lactococcus garvieae]|uniref:WxL domain-containing protein n=1 Tax=Lactococcus garvieae DCC43 TaxID=1231377 RepID=K2NSQ0_9LACT|nr:WxL domain-containing protein [Lactococcus garvieae]EKF50573.1 hypothetical protein C426_2077 [Lactococcus garvieae DCC43]
MAKVQNLLKKSINIATSTLLLLSASLSISTLVFPDHPAKADTNSTNEVLVPGVTSDTGDHNYSDLPISTIHSMGTWLALGTTQENVPGTNWFGMATNGTNQAGYAIFKGAMDASQPFSISGYFRTASSGANYKDSGDSNGFILTPESINQINSNATKYTGNSNSAKPVIYPTGPGLGIGGLSGSIFAGRDLYYNSPTSGTAADSDKSAIDGIYNGSGTGVSGSSPAISIRTTRDASGASIISGDASVGTAGELVYGKGSTTTTGVGVNLGYPNAVGPDTSYFTLFGNFSTQDDTMTLTWSNPVASADEKSYTGTLSLTVQGMSADGIATGNPVTITQTSVTIPRTISVGAIGATGGNYGSLSFSNNSSLINGNRGQKDVKVNYINSVTGKKISSSETTPIKANVGDIVNVLSPTKTGSSTSGLPGKYEFTAPTNATFNALTGYTFEKITYGGVFDETTGTLTGDGVNDPNGSAGTNNGITVSNFDNLANPNQINIFYTPTMQEASFATGYLAGTPGTSIVGTVEPNNIEVALPSVTPTTPGFASPLPTYTSTSAYTDAIAPMPQVSNMPVGYSVLQVLTSGGKVYTTESAITAGYASALAYALADNPLIDPGNKDFVGVPNKFLVILSPDQHSATWKYQYDSNTPGYNGNEGIAALPTLPTVPTQEGVTGLPITDPGVAELPAGYEVSQISDATGTHYGPSENLTLPSVFLNKYFPYIFMNPATYTDSTMNTPVFGTESSFTFLVSALPQTGEVEFKYNVGTPGTDEEGKPEVDSEGNPIPVIDESKGTLGIASSLPPTQALNGLTGGSLYFDLSKTIPTGYTVDTVVGPDHIKYTDDTVSGKTAVQAALKANPYFEDSSQSTNSFTIYLRAESKTASIAIKMDNSQTPSGTVIPEEQNFVLGEGLVGEPILESDIEKAITTLTSGGGVLDITSSIYDNWNVTSLSGPANTIISTAGEMNNQIAAEKLSDLVASQPYYLAGNSIYEIHMSYNGTLSLRVPSTIDFGNHEISGKSSTYKGSMEKSVYVIDSRTTPTAWTLKVQQSSPLIGYGENTGVIIPQLELSGSLHFVDTQSNDTLLTDDTSATVYQQTSGSNELVEAMTNSNEGEKGFYLDTLANKQISKWYGDDVVYKGEILWTVSNTP